MGNHGFRKRRKEKKREGGWSMRLRRERELKKGKKKVG